MPVVESARDFGRGAWYFFVGILILANGAMYVGAGLIGNRGPPATISGFVLIGIGAVLGLRARKLGVRIFDPTAKPRDTTMNKP